MATIDSGSNVATQAQPVRICKIAGRYLVFDPEAVAMMRRKHNMSGTLVGTTPQQPTQNIFLGLPVELRPEEADALSQIGAAYVVDDVAAHREALLSLASNQSRRQAYVESLRRRKAAAREALVDRSARKAAIFAERYGSPSSPAPEDDGSRCDRGQHERVPPHVAESRSQALPAPCVTMVSSSDLFPRASHPRFNKIESIGGGGALCRHLQAGGYYMTPGLRFGSQYSVYPGDPLRFHAHFMAVEYAWDQDVAILDIVGGGRLATAVKKAFLVGGERSSPQQNPVQTFSIEWAAM